MISLTLTDHPSVVTEATAVVVDEGVMEATEQIYLRTSTLDTTHSRRLGDVTEQTTCYSNSTYVNMQTNMDRHSRVNTPPPEKQTAP